MKSRTLKLTLILIVVKIIYHVQEKYPTSTENQIHAKLCGKLVIKITAWNYKDKSWSADFAMQQYPLLK
jgi:hypothetical protein